MPADRRADGASVSGGYAPGEPYVNDTDDTDDAYESYETDDDVLDEDATGGDRHAGAGRERHTSRGARSVRPRRLDAATAGRAGLRHVLDLTGKDVEGVTAVRPANDGWTVEVEVVEDHRVPSSGDTLAIYAVDLDSHGGLVSYARARCFKRAKGDSGPGY